MADKFPFQPNIEKQKRLNTASKETRAIQSGIGNTHSSEPKFLYNVADNEIVLGGNEKNEHLNWFALLGQFFHKLFLKVADLLSHSFLSNNEL